MILTTQQAKSVHIAHCALMGHGAELSATLDRKDVRGPDGPDFVRVFEEVGSVKVVEVVGFRVKTSEVYVSWDHFAGAYNV